MAKTTATKKGSASKVVAKPATKVVSKPFFVKENISRTQKPAKPVFKKPDDFNERFESNEDDRFYVTRDQEHNCYSVFKRVNHAVTGELKPEKQVGYDYPLDDEGFAAAQSVCNQFNLLDD